MLFRALRHLNIGIAEGEVFKASRLKPAVRDLLLVRGIIAPVNAPPITALSEFEAVAETLVAAGVCTPEELVEAGSVEGLSPGELSAWQSKAIAVMTVNHPCKSCHRR